MSETTTQSMTTCGNRRHPDGPWHLATPLPASWELLARFRYWRNKRRWGCGCEALSLPRRPATARQIIEYGQARFRHGYHEGYEEGGRQAIKEMEANIPALNAQLDASAVATFDQGRRQGYDKGWTEGSDGETYDPPTLSIPGGAQVPPIQVNDDGTLAPRRVEKP